MTRTATPANESVLLHVARHATAVTGVRRDDRRDRRGRRRTSARHRSQDAHHPIGPRPCAEDARRASGGETKLDNLIMLCGFHHRLVHEGGYGLRRTDDGPFIFTRPDGSRVERNGAQRFSGNLHGETMDYSQAIEAMQALEAARPAAPLIPPTQ